MKSGYTTSVSLANQILAVIAAAKGDPQAAREAVGLDQTVLGDLNGRIPIEQVFALYAEAEAQTRDRNIGLRMAGGHHPIQNSIILHVFMSSATIGEGIGHAVRLQQLITEGMEHVLVVEGEQARFSITPKDNRLLVPRHMTEAGLGSLVMFCRSTLGEKFVLHRVAFQHPEPADTTEQRALFGPSMAFGQPRNELVMDRNILEHPMAGSNQGLREILEQQAQTMLANLPRRGDFLDLARETLSTRLPYGGPAIGEIAKSLGISPRTFQRRLQQAGTTYQALLDEVRCQLAQDYLKKQNTPLFEIAYLLGFTEQSAFNRAFKRWMRMTPGEFRVTSL